MKLILGFIAAFFALVLIKNVFLAIVGSWMTILLVILAVIGVAVAWTIVKTFTDVNRAGKKMAKQQRAELLARAVNQNTAYMQGLDRGIYGDFPPEKLA